MAGINLYNNAVSEKRFKWVSFIMVQICEAFYKSTSLLEVIEETGV